MMLNAKTMVVLIEIGRAAANEFAATLAGKVMNKIVTLKGKPLKYADLDNAMLGKSNYLANLRSEAFTEHTLSCQASSIAGQFLRCLDPIDPIGTITCLRWPNRPYQNRLVALAATAPDAGTNDARFAGSQVGSTTNEEDLRIAGAMRDLGDQQPGDAPISLPLVDIDDGTQKYVLFEVGERHLVRGSRSAEYHKDAAMTTVRQLDSAGVRFGILGGGRISHESAKKKILVYGFSYGFPWKGGKCRHDLTCESLRKHFGNDYNISFSDDGY